MKFRSKFIICISLIVLFPTLVNATSHEDIKREAEIFAREGLIEAKNIVDATTPEDTPGYEENPEQSEYYNNNGLMESDAISQKENDEKTAIIEDSFNMKAEYKEDAQSTGVTSEYIENNPLENIEENSGIIGSLDGEYAQCESVQPLEQYYTTRICDEYESLRGSCYLGNHISLNNNTNYTCRKTKEFYNKTITENRSVSCNTKQRQFFETTSQNFQGFKVSGNNLYLGVNSQSLGGNCGGYRFKWKFKIDNLDDVGRLYYQSLVLDDTIRVYVNGSQVWSWGSSCEHGAIRSFSPNLDLKPYLVRGDNEIEFKVIVGGSGRFYSHLKWDYNRCTEFNDEWSSAIERDVEIFDENKEEICERSSPEECLLDGEFETSDGYLKSGCRKKVSEYNCTQNEFTDYCKSISQVEVCNKFNSQCLETNESGTCELFEERYTCGDLAYYSEKEHNVLIDSPYSVSFGEVGSPSICSQESDLEHCDIISNKTGEKSCYLGSSKSDCGEYDENASCLLENTICHNEQCSHKEKKYHCLLGDEEVPSEILQCSGQEYCLDESCAGVIEYEANNSLPTVLTYLKAIEEAGKDSDKDTVDVTIFTGQSNSCEKDIFGANNCCKNSGWGDSVGIGGCSYEEENLGLQKEEGLCVYVGSYCSEEEDLTGTCLKKAEGYCCFNSKLSRIIQQQGKSQIGVGFGSGESPQCRGFTVQELQSIDFSQINFSEYTRELTIDMQQISKDDLEGDIINTIGGGE